MKQSRFTDGRIVAVLKQAEAGTPTPGVCRKHGTRLTIFCEGWSKHAGMDASLMARMRESEAENAGLQKMSAEERPKAEIIQEAMEKGVKPSWGRFAGRSCSWGNPLRFFKGKCRGFRGAKVSACIERVRHGLLNQ